MVRSLEALMQWEEQYMSVLAINYPPLSKGFKRFHVLQSTRKVSIISSLMDDAGWCHYEGMLHVPPTMWVRIIAFSGRHCGIQWDYAAAVCRCLDLRWLLQALQPRKTRLCSLVLINSHKYEYQKDLSSSYTDLLNPSLTKSKCGSTFPTQRIHSFPRHRSFVLLVRVDVDENGMILAEEKPCTRRKPDPMPHCPPQILNRVTWDRAGASAVKGRKLIAWKWNCPPFQHNNVFALYIDIYLLYI